MGSLNDFPIACLGASAGGLGPYTEVIQEIPADAGIALVVVTHARRTRTRLKEILARHTSMPVEVIAPGLKPAPNHVYIIPQDQDLTLRGKAPFLSPLTKEHGWPTVITVFLDLWRASGNSRHRGYSLGPRFRRR